MGKILAVFLALAIGLIGGIETAGAEECTLRRVAALPMTDMESGSPVVSIPVDDQPRKLLLDTGGFGSVLDPALAERYRSRQSPVVGSLGLSGVLLNRLVTVPSLQIGAARFRNVDFFVAPKGYLAVDGTLGANWLQLFDVEIDPINNVASLFAQRHCSQQVAYWPHRDLTELPVHIDRVQKQITVPVTLDGRQVNALIDTGSSESYLNMRVAERQFDLSPESPGMQPTEIGIARDGAAQRSYRYQFKSLEMGDIVFKNPWLTLAPMAGGQADMVLGMRHLRGLHLFFAYGVKKLYVTTAHGDIAEQRARRGLNAAAPGTEPLDRTNAEDFRRTADNAIAKGDRDSAMAAIEEALRLDPTYALAHITRAELFAAKGLRSRALEDLDEAVRLEPMSGIALVERSQMFFLAGDNDSARADVEKAIQADPSFAPAYLVRAELDAAKGARDRAMGDLDDALRLDPANLNAYLARSQIYEEAGDMEHAFADADRAVRLQPKSPAALNGRCWTGAILGRLGGALADCNAALAVSPHSAPILDSRAYVRFKAGQFDLALADYSAALEADPRFASSLYGRGLVKRQIGDASGAAADIAAARRTDPHIAEYFGK